MGELLVEETPQPVEFGLVAKVLCGNLLVMGGGEDNIVAVGWQRGEGQFGPVRIARCLGVLLVLGEIVGSGVGGFHLALLLLFGGGV